MNYNWDVFDCETGYRYNDKDLALGLFLKRNIYDKFLTVLIDEGIPLFRYFRAKQIESEKNMKNKSKNQRKKSQLQSFINTKLADDLYDLYELCATGLINKPHLIIMKINVIKQDKLRINNTNSKIQKEYIIELFKNNNKDNDKDKDNWIVCVPDKKYSFCMDITQFLRHLPWKFSANQEKFIHGVINYINYSSDGLYTPRMPEEKFNNIIDMNARVSVLVDKINKL